MAMTLFGSSLGYRPEQAAFQHLHAIKVKQEFEALVADGVSNTQSAVFQAMENLHSQYDFDKLSPAAQAQIDRNLDRVGLNRKQVVHELNEKIARFRDNFRPSAFARPGF